MQSQLAMRELTLDEIEAVSGAGFWSDLWESISGAFTASADFLGFDGRFGAGGGGGGLSFGNFGNALGEGLGTIWNLPNTAIGLLVGGAGYAFDHVFGDGSAQVSLGSDGVIRFTDNPSTPLGAITFGQVETFGEGYTHTPFGGPTPADFAHEDAHVSQGALLGPFYIPSNAFGGLAGLIFNNGNWHGDANWNETGPQSNPPTPW